jgi:hypothetical protein
MENLNKLTFKTYKIDESVLNIPMDDIRQEFDTTEYSRKYIFNVLYVAKQLKDGNYIVYLGPPEKSKLPIVKATIPFEIIRTDRILPNYRYDRELDRQERYTVDERVYRSISTINARAHSVYGCRCYVLVYGYLVNPYKDVNALTTLKDGIQEFHISQNTYGSFKVTRSKTTTCLVTTKWEKVCSALEKEYCKVPDFKKLPKGFFVE